MSGLSCWRVRSSVRIRLIYIFYNFRLVDIDFVLYNCWYMSVVYFDQRLGCGLQTLAQKCFFTFFAWKNIKKEQKSKKEANQILTSRQTTFMAVKNNKKRVGLNAFANRVFILNGRIPLDWFNMSLNTFKVQSKKRVSDVKL